MKLLFIFTIMCAFAHIVSAIKVEIYKSCGLDFIMKQKRWQFIANIFLTITIVLILIMLAVIMSN